MDYTAPQLYNIWNAGLELVAIKELRRLSDCSHTEAKEAFENSTVDEALKNNRRTLAYRRLTESAPRLLETLKQARGFVNDRVDPYRQDHRPNRVLVEIDLVIAQAEGR